MFSIGLVVGAAVAYFWRSAETGDKGQPSRVAQADARPVASSPVQGGTRPVAAARRSDPPIAAEKTGEILTLAEFQRAFEELGREAHPRGMQGDGGKLFARLDERDLPSAMAIVLRSRTQWLRIWGLQVLFKRWAQSDPETAVREAQAITVQDNRNAALAGTFQAWSKKDAAGLVQWLQSQPKGQSFARILQAAIPGLAENAPEAAYLLLQNMAPHLLRNYAYSIFTSWARTDPVTALSRMMAMPSSRSWGGSVQGIVAEWAQRDFAAAEAWVNAQPEGGIQAEARRGLLGALAATDPARAAALALAVPDAQERKNSLQSILLPWIQTDLAGAVAWVKQLQDESLRQVAIPQIMDSWFAANPAEALEYAMTLPAGKQRTAALVIIAGSWANSDAKAAVEWLKSLPTGREQQMALQSSIYALAQSDPVATSALLDAMPASAARRNCMAGLLQSWIEVDSDKALEWARSLPSAMDRAQACQQLAYTSWAMQSPTQAAEMLMSLPAGRQRDNGISSLVSRWAQQDLQGALDWSLTLEDEVLAKQALRSLQSPWVELNPLEAVTFIQGRRDLAGKGALASAVNQWAASDPVAAITWVAQLPSGEMEPLLPQAIGNWAESNPVEAATYVSKLQPGKLQNEAAAQTVSRWAQQDPARAAKWAAGFSNEELRNRACRDVVNVWAQNDPDSAGAWVKELPAGKARESALGSLVTLLQYNDPQAAARWAEAVADPAQRNQLLTGVARRWLEVDPGARDWIIRSSLPEDTKTRLLKAGGR